MKTDMTCPASEEKFSTIEVRGVAEGNIPWSHSSKKLLLKPGEVFLSFSHSR